MMDSMTKQDAINRYIAARGNRDRTLEAAKSVAAAWSYGVSKGISDDYNIYFTGEGSDLARRMMIFADEEVTLAKKHLYEVFPKGDD